MPIEIRLFFLHIRDGLPSEPRRACVGFAWKTKRAGLSAFDKMRMTSNSMKP